MAKRRSAGRNKNILLRLALLVFSVYMVYSMISLQSQLAAKKRELEENQRVISEQNMSIEEIKQLLDNGSKNDLIERAARDKLDFVFKNEEIYEDISGK